MVDHAFGSDALPVENVVKIVTIGNVNRDHRIILKRGNSGNERLKVEGGLHDDDRRSALLFFVAGQKLLERSVHLLHVDLYAYFEGVIWL